MPSRQIAGITIDVDDEGFLTDSHQWNENIASALAKELDVNLSDAHWKIINFIRQDTVATGYTPNVRRISSMTGVGIKELYILFPKGPAKQAAKIAGCQKPVGCV